MDFSDLHVLVIGDIILDEFLYGISNRQSPEFDAPVVEVEEKIQNLGGAANVACNIRGLGAKLSLISVIGTDPEGDRIVELLHEAECASNHIHRSKTRKSTLKSRLYSNGIPIARVDHEETNAISQTEEEELISLMDIFFKLKNIDGILLQDYNKGVLTPKVIKHAIQKANDLGIPSFVDPKIENIEAYANCSFIKPNLSEFVHILGQKPDLSLENLDQAALKFQEYVSHDTLVLTLSEKGAYFTDGNQSDIISTTPIENADVCGAGDSFISAFCLAKLKNLDVSECIQFANKVSNISCSHRGVHAAQLNDLESSN